MVGALSQGGVIGDEIFNAERKCLITDASTTVLKAARGKLAHISIWAVGTTYTLDIYDDPATTNNRVWQWVTADGKKDVDLNFPMANGITAITTGTAGGITITYS